MKVSAPATKLFDVAAIKSTTYVQPIAMMYRYMGDRIKQNLILRF
jgi:hypothetical protein